MAVHRGDQAGGQGLLPFRIATGLAWGTGACPTSLPHRVRDTGTAEKSAAVPPTMRRIGRHHPGMVGGIYPEMTWACSQKQSPGSCAAPGLLMSRWGAGGSATLVRFIGSPSSAAKSSLGYRVSRRCWNGTPNDGEDEMIVASQPKLLAQVRSATRNFRSVNRITFAGRCRLQVCVRRRTRPPPTR
jgi:hypothetical protein